MRITFSSSLAMCISTPNPFIPPTISYILLSSASFPPYSPPFLPPTLAFPASIHTLSSMGIRRTHGQIEILVTGGIPLSFTSSHYGETHNAALCILMRNGDSSLGSRGFHWLNAETTRVTLGWDALKFHSFSCSSGLRCMQFRSEVVRGDKCSF